MNLLDHFQPLLVATFRAVLTASWQGSIAIVWCTDDVKHVRPDLTDTQCMEVLQRCSDEHDAMLGLSWDTIRIHAESLFPEPSRTDEEDSL